MKSEKPVNVEDERVGKHFEEVRTGATYCCSVAVMFKGHKFLTLVKVRDGDTLKIYKKKFYKKLKMTKSEIKAQEKIVHTISWCISEEWSDAAFYMNYMEM